MRNRVDGSVEALARGPADALQALIDWAHQGPAMAQVQAVQVSDARLDDCAPFTGFAQRETV